MTKPETTPTTQNADATTRADLAALMARFDAMKAAWETEHGTDHEAAFFAAFSARLGLNPFNTARLTPKAHRNQIDLYCRLIRHALLTGTPLPQNVINQHTALIYVLADEAAANATPEAVTVTFSITPPQWNALPESFKTGITRRIHQRFQLDTWTRAEVTISANGMLTWTYHPAATWPAPLIDEPSMAIVAATADEYGRCLTTDGCYADPAGECDHGHPSWFLVWGIS